MTRKKDPQTEDNPGQGGEGAGVVAFQPRGVGLKGTGSMKNRVISTIHTRSAGENTVCKHLRYFAQR